MQQIGFALPAVFGIITSLAFNLGGNNVPDINVMLFYFSIALFVVPGIICWVSNFELFVYFDYFSFLFVFSIALHA